MLLLIAYLFLAIGVSFFCSIMEAVILSVTPSFVEALRQKSPEIGNRLMHLKANIDLPLAAILTLNTIAHTVGAAGVGAQALVVFGNAYVALTSAVLTFLILIFSEVIPKTLGASHWHRLAPLTASILPVLMWALYPLVFLSKKIAGWLSPEKKGTMVSREEVQALTDLARKSGAFSEHESRILKNLIRVGKLKVKDVMTPRPVMFTLPAEMTVGAAMESLAEMRFSRIPLCKGAPEDIVETLLGIEIVDETDTTIDMQAMARRQWALRARSMGLIPPASESASEEGGPGGMVCTDREIRG